jgi:hypothetical protein
MSRLPIFLLLIAASLLVGWFIPSFYIWTDSDQSRPSPLLWQVPLTLAIGSAAFCLALPWLPITNQGPSNTQPAPPPRFSLRSLLLVTAVVAIAIPLLAKIPAVVTGIVSVGTVGCLIAFGRRNPQHRKALLTLAACMYFPYAWVIDYYGLSHMIPSLVMISGMPALVPAALVVQLLNQNIHEARWLTFLVTALEAGLGIWVMRLGPKRTIAYLLAVMQISILGSLALYMMVRA